MKWCWLHKECHNCIKILILNDNILVPWFTKDQEGHKIYGDSGNKVLDTFSRIQYMTISCLHHANINCNLIGALKIEWLHLKWQNVAQNTRVMRLLWQYTLTDCTVYDSVCKSKFLWNILCTLELSIIYIDDYSHCENSFNSRVVYHGCKVYFGSRG